MNHFLEVITGIGVVLGESTIRRITEGHAQTIFETAQFHESWPAQSGPETVIAQMDGGMVPIVEPEAVQKDKRKGKQLQWKEAKICLVHAKGTKTLAYGGTLQGDVAQAGRELFHCARVAGSGSNSRIHAVGDGADRIATQVEEQFGAQGDYLVDFYHIGSGEIGSAHRYIVQQRLKRPGSWWRAANADHMLALRLKCEIDGCNVRKAVAGVAP